MLKMEAGRTGLYYVSVGVQAFRDWSQKNPPTSMSYLNVEEYKFEHKLFTL